MNEKLIRYLTANQEEFTGRWSQKLRSEWNLRIASNCLSGNKGGTRMTSLLEKGTSKTDEMFSLLVGRYYTDLIDCMKNRSDDESLREEFPHYSPYGIRMTLGSLLELLLTGESMFAEIFLDEVNANFSGMKGIDAFNQVSYKMRKVFQVYAQIFCNECTTPLVNTIREMAKVGKEEKTKGKNYDRYPYSV